MAVPPAPLSFADPVDHDLPASPEGAQPVSALVPRFIHRLRMMNGPEGRRLPGLMTGFAALDRLTLGLHGGDLTVLAAVPGMGKSAFALNVALHVALQERQPVLFFSLEMNRQRLIERMMSASARVPLHAIRSGRLREAEWVRVAQAAEQVGHANLLVDDRPAPGVAEVQARALEHARRVERPALVVVDYLQLMSGRAGPGAENRRAEIREISRGLKSLARQLMAPVLLTAQIHRAPESRLSRRPALSDLQGTGALAEDADVVMLLHRDDYYNHMSQDAGTAELILCKQRNGPAASARLAFSKSLMRFDDLDAEARAAG